MKPAVRDAFVDFSSRFEGVVPWMYLDIKGLVTVAIGNLIDPVSSALTLPFVYKGTTIPAPHDTILREWTMVKAHPTAAHDGHRVLESITSLRLTDDGAQEVVMRKLDVNDYLLGVRFEKWDTWPADAQLATHSMAWACGPAFAFPALVAALRAGDFAKAATLCHIDDSHNAGVTPRNAANVKLYELAARVVAEERDPEALLYGAATPLPPADIIHPEVLPE